jgi:predicted dehydrogenase
MKKSQHSRRNFLKQSGTALLALSALQYKSVVAQSPNDRINVGFIGVGGMGTNRLNGFIREDDVYAYAICDVDSEHRDAGIEIVNKRKEHKPKGFSDFRKLLEEQDIDAVMIATPDHWHARTFVSACEAGKDAFVEKPLAYSVGEGRKMVEAAKQYNRVSQMGIHIHNEHNTYRRCVEMVKSGNLGEITKVELWKASYLEGKGSPTETTPPASLDYDFWQGPAPKHEYNPNRSHFNFRYFWDYSGGVFIDFWCHITDVAYWALDLEAPLSVTASGGRVGIEDNTETPNYLDLLYKYPNGLTMTWNIHPNGNPGYDKEFGGIGCIFHGTKGALITNYEKHKVYVDGKEAVDFPTPPESIPNSPGHIREFLDCIKSRELPTCNVEYGHKLTKGGLLGNIAYRTGTTIEFDNKTETITNSKKADKLIMRKYRSPWSI